MQPEEVTGLTALQLAITSHMVEHEGSPQSQGQDLSPQAPCVASVLTATCWTLEVGVAVLLMTLAAAVILALLYWALRLRHKLKVARAGNALEYWGFFRSARYDLKEPYLPEAFPVPMAMTVVTPGPEVAAPPVADSKPPLEPPPPPPPVSPPQDQLPPPYSEPPPPCLPSTSTALLPPPEPPAQLRRPSPIPRRLTGKTPPSPRGSPVLRTTSVPIIPFPSLPRPHHPLPPAPPPPRPLSAQPLPFIHTTPPSPHLSWGACSDVDVYSRVGSMRLSQTSSHSQTQASSLELLSGADAGDLTSDLKLLSSHSVTPQLIHVQAAAHYRKKNTSTLPTQRRLLNTNQGGSPTD